VNFVLELGAGQGELGPLTPLPFCVAAATARRCRALQNWS